MNPKLNAELEAWLRPVSPLTAHFQSLRMEEQQQQQQQQQSEPVDPFAGIDLNLLDDATRAKIENARGQFATVAKLATDGRKFQSDFDRMKAEKEALEAQLGQQQQQQQQQQQRDPNTPKTVEQELTEYYQGQGMTPADAARVAKVQAGAANIVGRHTRAQMNNDLAPIVGAVIDGGAREAFEQVLEESAMVASDPEIAQQLWDHTTKMAQAGQVVNKDIIQNLGYIFVAKKAEKNGGALPSMTNPDQHQQTQPGVPVITRNPTIEDMQNRGTQFTFPGAARGGNHVRNPNTNTSRSSSLDPDTSAAMAATVANWAVKPKAYQPAQR